MSIVYPQYWNHSQCSDTLKVDFIEKCKIFQSHFCREVEIQGEHIQGIFDPKNLPDEDQRFYTTMWEKFSKLDNPLGYGAIKRLRNKLSRREILQQKMLEYFK